MRIFFIGLLPVILSFAIFASSEFAIGEDAYRANNLGVALLEQYKHDDAVAEFKRALELNPDLKMARLNLAIAFFNAQKLAEAKQVALAVVEKEPHSPHANYLLGLIGRAENDQDASLAAFRRVLSIDPLDVGTNVNIGQVLSQRRQYDEAIERFQIAYDAEPYNTTAIYNLATTLQRKGERTRAAELLKLFQSLRDSGAGTSIGISYLEQGRYAEAIASTGAESELVDKTEPKVTFRDVNIGLPSSKSSKPVKLFDKVATLIDIDGDGDLDIAQTVPAKIFRNDKGKFTDVTRSAGDFAKAANSFCYSILAGDFDSDGNTDLFGSWRGKLALYRNVGRGKFIDVTTASKIPNLRIGAQTSAFADIDHDGDLDIVLNELGDGGNFVFRNNGDGTFADISATSGVKAGVTNTHSIIPTDYDNRRDTDLLFVGKRDLQMMRNLRNGTFKNVAKETGLKIDGELCCAAAVGDFSKDSYVDFFIGRIGRPGVFAASNGRGGFSVTEAPNSTADATAAIFFDYDSDGLLDLAVNTTKGMTLLRNVGDTWQSPVANPLKTTADISASKQILAADLDADGDMDLLTYAKNGSLRLLRNDGGNANASETLMLQGRVSNKTGIGAKVDLRSGSLAQKLETYSTSPAVAPSQVHFGLGKRDGPDAVRIIWTSGILQSETDFTALSANRFSPIKIQELDRKPSSCPYLYTWNGEKFEFITDFLGGGEMGNWAAPGVYHKPDSDEFVRIPPGKLKPRNGRYEIRVTNELEEVLFLDHVKLVAVEHDVGSDIYPNEGLGIPTFGKQILYTTSNAKPPLSATDKDGKNVLAKVAHLDQSFYDGFSDLPIRGYAEQHELTLNLDNKKSYNGRTLLLLTGWTDYAFSSDNLAASQSGKSLAMPFLQVKNASGDWQTVIKSIGISVGRPQTVVVDLTGEFLTDSREVRIVTNFRTYWDKIEVDTSEQNSDLKTIELQPLNAELRERGFSAEKIINGMIVADYEKVSFDGRWKNFTGRFTRFGDVGPLLSQIDDTFVISKTGDELALSFSALTIPPAGKQYTFLLYADGYSKEMDINSGSPDAVFPLPFKGMTKYPYDDDERYPMTDEMQRIFDNYTTRSAGRPVPNIDLALQR